MKKEVLLKDLGERIRKIRIEKGMSQAKLANTVGKDQQSVQRLEKGKTNPSYYYLHEIAQGLGVPVERLVSLNDDSLKSTS